MGIGIGRKICEISVDPNCLKYQLLLSVNERGEMVSLLGREHPVDLIGLALLGQPDEDT